MWETHDVFAVAAVSQSEIYCPPLAAELHRVIISGLQRCGLINTEKLEGLGVTLVREAYPNVVSRQASL